MTAPAAQIAALARTIRQLFKNLRFQMIDDRTISTLSATLISAATAVCRSTLGPTCTTGSIIIRPNIAFILSGQGAQIALC